MPDVVVLVLAASATALATGIGAIPVFYLGDRAAQLTPFLLGFAAGVMGVAVDRRAADPGDRRRIGSTVLAGLAVGAACSSSPAVRFSPDTGFMGRSGPGARTSALVFLVLFVHSLPEGFAVGTAFASDRAGLSLFVILAIAIQNIPEGTSVAIPMEAAGFGRGRQFWAAVGDQRAAAGRRADRLPRGRAGQRPAAVLLRLRRRGDAGADRGRDAAGGLRRPARAGPSAGIAARRRAHARPQLRPRRLSVPAAISSGHSMKREPNQSNWRTWLIGILIALVVIVALQNSQEVRIDVLFVNVNAPLIVTLLVAVGIGVLIGYAAPVLLRHRRDERRRREAS